MKTVYFDISNLLENPIRTGLQRVVREIIKAWPPHVKLVPVRYDWTVGLRRVNQEALQYALESGAEEDVSVAEAASQILFLDDPANAEVIQLEPGTKVHIPELFFNKGRTEFYLEALKAGIDVSLLIPDFLPWLNPQFFPGMASSATLTPYLCLAMATPKRAFISQSVRRLFEERIFRAPAGDQAIVTELGADGIVIPRQVFRPDRKRILFLGTLEPRKGQHMAYEAFCKRENTAGLKLDIVGTVPANLNKVFLPLIENKNPDVRLLSSATDADIAAIYGDLRASIFTSSGEGYGLPPLESLSAGVPVIVLKDLPGLEGKPDLGQIRLDAATPEHISRALNMIEDDGVCAKLWADAARFPNVSWRSVARNLADWV